MGYNPTESVDVEHAITEATDSLVSIQIQHLNVENQNLQNLAQRCRDYQPFCVQYQRKRRMTLPPPLAPHISVTCPRSFYSYFLFIK